MTSPSYGKIATGSICCTKSAGACRASAGGISTSKLPESCFAAGRRERISSICAAVVGDATVSVRMRRPAPFFGSCALSTLRMATTNALNG